MTQRTDCRNCGGDGFTLDAPVCPACQGRRTTASRHTYDPDAIHLRRRTIDGISERKSYVKALRAGDYVNKWLGRRFDIGPTGTAVSADGTQTIIATPMAWHRMGHHDLCNHNAAEIAATAEFRAAALERDAAKAQLQADLMDTATVPDAALAQAGFAAELAVPFKSGQLGMAL